MTLAQLQSFVLVARLGSVKAAAAELEVTEPAVSVAVAALRKELGDELFVRDGRGIALTAGGRRLAALASEILGAGRAGAPVGAGLAGPAAADAGRGRRTSSPSTSGPLIDAFTARDPGPRGRDRSASPAPIRRAAGAPPRRHRARPAPGARARGDDRSVPFLRCRLIVVAAPDHPLAGRRDIAGRRAGRPPMADRSPRARPDRPAPGCCSRAPGSSPLRSSPTAAMPPRSPPRPRATGMRADARPHGVDRGPPPGADADRRARHADPRAVACLDARLRPGAARGARACSGSRPVPRRPS